MTDFPNDFLVAEIEKVLDANPLLNIRSYETLEIARTIALACQPDIDVLVEELEDDAATLAGCRIEIAEHVETAIRLKGEIDALEDHKLDNERTITRLRREAFNQHHPHRDEI